MENTNIVDKIYLALELTKILYGNSNIGWGSNNVYNSFEYFLKRLTGIEDLSVVDKLKDENDTLHALYEDLKEKVKNDTIKEKKINDLLNIIESNRGDMEPRVYNLLVTNLKTWQFTLPSFYMLNFIKTIDINDFKKYN